MDEAEDVVGCRKQLQRLIRGSRGNSYLRKGMESMCAEANDQLMAAPAVSPMMYVPVCGVDSCLGYTHCIASVRTPSTNTPVNILISIT
jgi:hypothetical protein